MASGFTTQTEALNYLDSMLHEKSQQLASRQRTLNRAVLAVISDIDLRGTKRRAALSPNIFDNIYDYGAPSDLKDRAIIDIRAQIRRSVSAKWRLMDEETFDRFKETEDHIITVADDELVRTLRISGLEGTKNANIHNCDSVTANGTWAASADASNVTADTDNYVEGGGSLNFDMAAGAATGVLELTGAAQVDLTDHDEKSSIFVWVYIPDYSDAEGDTVTNFILRWGNDSSNYWSRTVTVNNEGATFYDGWNLLRFDWNGATETGTVDPAAIDYVRFTVTKSTSLAADTDWRIDQIISRVGAIHDVIYYSRFGWQTSANAYIAESTTTTDTLNLEEDELNLVLFKAAEYGAQELVDLRGEVPYFREEYERLKKRYISFYPSERIKENLKYWSSNPYRRK